MNLLVYSRWLLTFCLVSDRLTFGLDESGFKTEQGLREGEKQYELLVSRSKDPSYGPCWQKSINQMQADCEWLTAVVHSRLAFQLVNCFLETSGLATYPDCSGDDVKACVRQMNDRDIMSYATFFTHTQNMCCFLKSQLWRQKTDDTIDWLVKASSQAGKMLERTSTYQKQASAMQERLLHFQEESHRSVLKVNEVVEASRTSAAEVFQQLLTLRSTIFSELSSLYTMLYYTFSLTISYLLTTTKRTERARFWIFLIFTMAVVAENYLAKLDASLDEDMHPKLRYNQVWLIRYTSLVLSVVILVVCAWWYFDWNKASYSLLQENTLKLRTIEQQLQAIALRTPSEVSGYFSDSGHNHLAPIFSGNESLTNGSLDKTPLQKRQQGSVRRQQPQRDLHPLSSTPVRSRTSSSQSSRYNLRDRNLLRSSSPLAMTGSTDVLAVESAEAFAGVVERVARVTKQKSLELRRVLAEERRRNAAALSSPEDH